METPAGADVHHGGVFPHKAWHMGIMQGDGRLSIDPLASFVPALFHPLCTNRPSTHPPAYSAPNLIARNQATADRSPFLLATSFRRTGHTLGRCRIRTLHSQALVLAD